MATSTGFPQLVPKYILGSDYIGSVAYRIIGAQFKLANQLEPYFPFYGLAASNTVVVPRVDTAPTSSFIGNATTATDSSVPTLVTPATEFDITTIVGDVSLTQFAKKVDSYSVDQLQLQIDLKKIAAKIAFWDQFFKAASGAGFGGLPDLVDATTQLISPGSNGGPLTLELLDTLLTLVTEANAEMDSRYLIMNLPTFVKYRQLVRATGACMETTTVRASGKKYASHNGVPILISEYVPNNETLGSGSNLTSVYCCTLGYEDNGLFGAYPPGVGEDGWVVEKAQSEIDKDVGIYRVKLYTTVVLTQVKGLARLEGIDNS